MPDWKSIYNYLPQTDSLTLAVSLLFCGVFLYIYSVGKFSEPIFEPDSKLKPLLGGKADELAPNYGYKRGLLIYYGAFVLGFLSLCFIPLIAQWAYGKVYDSPTLAITWVGPAAPLYILSFLVVALPNLPVTKQIEVFFRELGQSVAGIPDVLSESVHQIKINKSSNSPSYRLIPNLSRRNDVIEAKYIATILDVPPNIKAGIIDGVTCVYLLSDVNLDSTQNIWSPKLVAKFRKLQTSLSLSTPACEAELQLLIREWKRLHRDAFDDALTTASIGLTFDNLVSSEIPLEESEGGDEKIRVVASQHLSSLEESDSELLRDTRKRWEQFSKQSADLSYLHKAQFSLFRINESKKTIEDLPEYIRSIVGGIKPEKITLIINAVLWASLVAVPVALFDIFAIIVARSWYRGDAVDDFYLVRTAINAAWAGSTTLIFLITLPVLVAIIFRYWRIKIQKWYYFYPNVDGPPVLQGLAIAASALGACAILQIGFDLTVQVFGEGTGDLHKIKDEFIVGAIPTEIATALIGSVLAIITCVILDLQKAGKLSVRVNGAITFITVLLLSLLFATIRFNVAPSAYFCADETVAGLARRACDTIRVFHDVDGRGEYFNIKRYDIYQTDIITLILFLTSFLIVFMHQLRSRIPS